MIEFFKKHIILLLTVVGTLIVLAMLIILYNTSQKNSQDDIVNEVVVSEAILSDSNATKLESTAASTALDNIFSFSNYGDTTQFLHGLLGSATENFRPRINELIKILEADESSSLFSRLNVNSLDYAVNVEDSNGAQTATVEFHGTLETNEHPLKEVVVKQRLIYQDPYWLLDDYQITDR